MDAVVARERAKRRCGPSQRAPVERRKLASTPPVRGGWFGAVRTGIDIAVLESNV